MGILFVYAFFPWILILSKLSQLLKFSVLVGAPSYKSVAGSVEDGAIFKCNATSSSPCTVLDTRGSGKDCVVISQFK